jgi:uncharacterized Zn finger protein
MRIICLNTQDCGHTRKLSHQEIKEINVNAPFSNCELCGYYALTTTNNVTEDLNLSKIATILQSFKER